MPEEAWHSLRTALQNSEKYQKISVLWKLIRLELEYVEHKPKAAVDRFLPQRQLDVTDPHDDAARPYSHGNECSEWYRG